MSPMKTGSVFCLFMVFIAFCMHGRSRARRSLDLGEISLYRPRQPCNNNKASSVNSGLTRQQKIPDL